MPMFQTFDGHRWVWMPGDQALKSETHGLKLAYLWDGVPDKVVAYNVSGDDPQIEAYVMCPDGHRRVTWLHCGGDPSTWFWEDRYRAPVGKEKPRFLDGVHPKELQLMVITDRSSKRRR
jgi:hypothetical protein